MYMVCTYNTMNIEDKQARLKELFREKFLSDDEQLEKNRLEEELQIIHNEETQPAKEPTKVEVKKQKRSLAQVLIEKLKSKPEPKATWDEINQLKLEYQKTELLQKIAKAKADTPTKKTGLARFLTSTTPIQIQSKVPKKTKHGSSNDSGSYDKLKGLISSNDSHKYDGLLRK